MVLKRPPVPILDLTFDGRVLVITGEDGEPNRPN
jgi:hypothetical protein